MNVSKKESELLLQFLLNFIKTLTTEQYQNLITGNATITITNDTHMYTQLRESLLKSENLDDIRSTFEGLLKSDILSFCKIDTIDVKKRDTKEVLFKKIATHYNVANQSGKVDKEQKNLKLIACALKGMRETEEARHYLLNNNYLKRKMDLIQLAKILDVYVNQNSKKNDILNRIIDSIVSSKIRAKIIRDE